MPDGDVFSGAQRGVGGLHRRPRSGWRGARSWLFAIGFVTVVGAGCRSSEVRLTIRNDSDQRLEHVTASLGGVDCNIGIIEHGETAECTVTPLRDSGLLLRYSPRNGEAGERQNDVGLYVTPGMRGSIQVSIDQEGAVVHEAKLSP